jgi:tRNA nucleotidyltransferase (CCA-adding enzyme)
VKPSLSFEDVREAIPDATAELLTKIAQTAASSGCGLNLVGGPVRDLLLGRALSDVDLMVQGDARALAEATASGRSGAGLTIVPHDRFGTVSIVSADASVDLAQLRHETYPQPGALPEVESGTLEQDAARRDFSINALICPLDSRDPERRVAILDLEGGLEDLAKKRLRVLHARSFHDDPTRAWRAARLAARLGFSLDRSSRNALRNALRDGAFGAVSGERFRRELQLAFDEARNGVSVGRILRILSDWHVLAALEPGLTIASDRMGPLRRLSKTIANPEWPALRWRGWVAGLKIWLAPMPAAQRRRVLERFSVRGEQAARIVRFGRDADRTLKALSKARGRGSVDASLSDLPEETIQALYAIADVPVRRRILRWGAEDRRRRSPVGGNELIELGLEGPEVGKALKRIRAGFLDGEVANREEALALAEEIARRAARRTPRKNSKSRSKSRGRKVARRTTITDTP